MHMDLAVLVWNVGLNNIWTQHAFSRSVEERWCHALEAPSKGELETQLGDLSHCRGRNYTEILHNAMLMKLAVLVRNGGLNSIWTKFKIWFKYAQLHTLFTYCANILKLCPHCSIFVQPSQRQYEPIKIMFKLHMAVWAVNADTDLWLVKFKLYSNSKITLGLS